MKPDKIAICNDTREFQNNRIFDKVWARKYPGVLWVYFFAQLARRKGYYLVTGDIALSHVEAGYWNPKEILVIQELDSLYGRKLIELGAVPTILTGFESPLYAYNFYDKLEEIGPRFSHRALYTGTLKTFKIKKGQNHVLHFPSYNLEDILPIKKWGNRRFLVMVAANKFFEKTFLIPPHYPTEYLDWIKDKFLKWQSRIRTQAVQNELITKRLGAIEYFGSKNLLDLFGRGWDDLSILPWYWRKRLKNVLANLKPKPVEDKLKTIASYKFALCFENVAYDGFITEKMVDCFLAGVIPIYLGASDVEDFVTKKAFIDMRNFDSWQALGKYLEELNEEKAMRIITAGRKFLQSRKGQLFNYKVAANFFAGLILK